MKHPQKKSSINNQDGNSDEPTNANDPASNDRRKAVAKLAYASPVIAGLLFTHAAAQNLNSPPPPPGG